MQVRGATTGIRGLFTGGGSQHGSRRPSPIIWVPSAIVAVAMVLPLVYLIERAVDSSGDSVDLLFSMRTAEIMMRSALLVSVVTAASVLIAVPLAWLTVRTDIPLRRLWSVLTVLPLAIPSYVGGFLVLSAWGPRGCFKDSSRMLQGSIDSRTSPGSMVRR